MLKIYNRNALTRQQRFKNAVVAGVAAGLLCAIVSILFIKFTGFYFVYCYVGIGWLIGMAIQKYGRGVQPQFSWLAVGITLVTFFVIDLYYYGSINIMLWALSYADISTVIDMACRIGGCVLAYQNARVI